MTLDTLGRSLPCLFWLLVTFCILPFYDSCIFSSALSTLAVGFGPIHIIQDSLISGSLITSAKTLSPNFVPSRGSRYLDMEGLFFSFGEHHVAQIVENLPVIFYRRSKFQSLGQEDPLEDGMATHSSIFALKTPWTEEPGRYNP